MSARQGGRPEDADRADKAAWAAGSDGETGPRGEAVVNDGTAGGDGAEAPVQSKDAVTGADGQDGGADAAAAAADPQDGHAAELAERTEDLQRVTAEFTNYRRRAERERVSASASAKAAVLAELLPVADDIERARAHGDLTDGPFKAFADKVLGVLSAQGVEEFGAEGDAFDPTVHEAVQDESTGGDPVVGAVLRKGYRLGDRTLRTAMVIVR